MESLLTHFKSLFENCLNPSTTRRNPLLILDRFYFKEKIFGHHLFLLDVKRKEVRQLHVPKVTNSDMGFKMIGSCNGLVCFIHYSLDQISTILLWNPVTRQTKRILEQQNALLPYKVPPNCLIGFFFNHSDGDYHVVRLHSFEDTNNVSLSDSLNKICAVRVEKYSLHAGLWREIKYCDQCLTVNGCLFWTENSVMLEGTLFWLAMEVSDKVSQEMIISFNSSNNVLSKIQLPFSINDCSGVHEKLAVYKDSVAVILCSETENMAQRLDLWVFYGKYEGVECWTKVETIGMFTRLERPVGIWKNEVLMATDKVMHSVNRTIAFLPEDGVGAEFEYNVFNYEESFVPLCDGNVIMEEADPIESKGFSLHDLFMSKLSIDVDSSYIYWDALHEFTYQPWIAY